MSKDIVEFMYDESSPTWLNDKEFNRKFVETTMVSIGAILKAKGWLCLNDIYNELGLARTKKGLIYGVVYDDKLPGMLYEVFGVKDTPNVLVCIHDVVNLLEAL